MEINLYELAAVAVVSGGAAFFGAYLKKKGENLATKEDVNSLIGEQAKIRAAIQRIEHDGWIRQQRWDLKRQAFWEALKLLNRFRNSLILRGGAVHAPEFEKRALELADEVTTALSICRAVLPEETLPRFDAASGPIRETERAPGERVQTITQVIRDLQTLVREELYPRDIE